MIDFTILIYCFTTAIITRVVPNKQWQAIVAVNNKLVSFAGNSDDRLAESGDWRFLDWRLGFPAYQNLRSSMTSA